MYKYLRGGVNNMLIYYICNFIITVFDQESQVQPHSESRGGPLRLSVGSCVNIR